ncbi:alpha-amylase family glycosyl hydrolase [Aegicerativicinus sediminis]|uniref:alpha-amylase family glycosyl hydrolase n=1 Tax=Aegicerativicinus sediminis TaxID=2893202 RepID=UPI001E3A392F|nr:alpha-amylase family glycosyl hydrolase [Aegicerativicinus sediminis]
MKKLLLLLLAIPIFGYAQQQTVSYSISPETFNEDESITLTFDGSTINESTWSVTNNALYLWAWSYDENDINSIDCPTNGSWTNSNEANKLTYNSGNDTYSISFVPTTFYNRTGIGKIGFLVKAKDGTGEKKSQDMDAEVGENNGPPVSIPEAAVPAGLKDGLNINPNDNTKVTLVLYAPEKSYVHIIGNFNDWQRDDDNYLLFKDPSTDRFWIELTNLTPQSNILYQYLVDGSIRVADPYSTLILDENDDPYIDETTFPNLPDYPTGKTEHPVTWFRLGDTPYNWEVTNFQPPAKTDLVIYELLVRDFDDLHSFDAVKARLDYLEGLGINAIELMPVNEFAGNLSWGYNPNFHMALDKFYGSPNSFKQLIDECHKRGIAVIIDVVYNHADGQNPFYRMWSSNNPFFNPTATHSYSVFNDFNHSKQATRDYVKRTSQYWIDEFKVDGFRWDLTKGFTQNCTPSDENCTGSYQQDRVDVLKLYADYQWEVDDDFIVIFEHLGGITEEKEWANYRASEGKGILLWNILNYQYTQAMEGRNSNSNFSNVSYKVKGFDEPSAISYMESHDEQRLMYNSLNFGLSNSSYNIKDLNTALSRMETAGAFLFTVPGPKMIWQFGELGYDFSINYCPDGSINNDCRTGEKPSAWEEGYNNVPERKAIYDTWADLIKLKLNEPIFKTTNFTIEAGSSTGLKSIHLTLDSATGDQIKHVTIIGNFGITEQAIDPKFQETGDWFEFLKGNLKTTVSNVNASITLAPGEFRIYGNEKSSLFPDNNIPDADGDGVADDDDLCPNTPTGTVVDINGCETFTLSADNFELSISSETCRNSDNGTINISAKEDLNYEATITGNGLNNSAAFSTNHTFNNLKAGAYEVCITVENETGYEICFDAVVTEPEDLAVLSTYFEDDKNVVLNLSGSSSYSIVINGTQMQTTDSEIIIPLSNGLNTISVEGDKICQGIYEEQIFVGEDVLAFPNPAQNNLNIYTGITSGPVNLKIFSVTGKLVLSEELELTNGKTQIDVSGISKGLYLLQLSSKEISKTLKIVKK